MKKLISVILSALILSTAQSAKAVFDGTDTPIVFAAVSDPAAAGLTGEDCQNITGVSNNIPSAMATYTDVAYGAGIPVYCGADSMVADGGYGSEDRGGDRSPRPAL